MDTAGVMYIIRRLLLRSIKHEKVNRIRCCLKVKSYITGIDPGAKGGIAVLDNSGKCIEAIQMPEMLVDTAKFLKRYTVRDSIIILEDVHSMPGQGVKSMFSFGRRFGELTGIITAFGTIEEYIRLEIVSSQKWKAAIFGKIEKIENETKEERKKRLKELSITKAKELYPDVNLLPGKKGKVESDGIAEALLLAEYGRRLYI